MRGFAVRKPDFLGIGATKAGTTWLYENLLKHPDIWLPPIKEIHYFDRSTDYASPSHLAVDSLSKRLLGRGKGSKAFRKNATRSLGKTLRQGQFGTLPWQLKYFGGRMSDQWYQSLFSGRAEHMVGEITPGYSLLDDDDVARVQAFLPNAKVIYLLRNPIERVWSGIRFRAPSGHETRDRADFNIDNTISAQRTDYLTTLRRWRQKFGHDRVGVFFYDDLASRPQWLIDQVFNYLGVAPAKVPGLDRRVYASSQADLPRDLHAQIAARYLPMLSDLHGELGTAHTAQWLSDAQAALDA